MTIQSTTMKVMISLVALSYCVSAASDGVATIEVSGCEDENFNGYYIQKEPTDLPLDLLTNFDHANAAPGIADYSKRWWIEHCTLPWYEKMPVPCNDCIAGLLWKAKFAGECEFSSNKSQEIRLKQQSCTSDNPCDAGLRGSYCKIWRCDTKRDDGLTVKEWSTSRMSTSSLIRPTALIHNEQYETMTSFINRFTYPRQDPGDEDTTRDLPPISGWISLDSSGFLDDRLRTGYDRFGSAMTVKHLPTIYERVLQQELAANTQHELPLKDYQGWISDREQQQDPRFEEMALRQCLARKSQFRNCKGFLCKKVGQE